MAAGEIADEPGAGEATMTADRGILIVSGSAGTGHVRAGEALREAFAAESPGRPVEHVDILALAPRWLAAAYGGGYELIAARAPGLWAEIYACTDGRGPDTAAWGGVAQRVLFRRFRRLVRSGRWEAVVCTHFLPCQLGAGRPGMPPFSLVVTDLTLHRYWVQRGVAQYFVALPALARELRARGVAASVDVTGIPLSARFAASPDRESARRALGLERRGPVALVMGGGLGFAVEEAVDAALASGVPGLRVLAVCGRNDAARRRLVARRAGPALTPLGYVKDIDRLMRAADVVVTKPGGLTTSEALAVGTPLILTRGVPGHEEGNAAVLIGAGAAIAAPDGDMLRAMLRRFFAEPAPGRALAARAAALGRADAAVAVARLVRARADRAVAA